MSKEVKGKGEKKKDKALKGPQKALMKGYEELRKEPVSYVTAAPVSMKNLLIWRAFITAPEGSLYEGGVFELKLEFPENFPFKPPKITFVTKIFHPNVSPAGDIEHPMFREWTAILNRPGKFLLYISVMLDKPLWKCPHFHSSSKVKLHEEDPEKYEKTAREWTKKYATKKKDEEK